LNSCKNSFMIKNEKYTGEKYITFIQKALCNEIHVTKYD
jgi:hypothetical protein